MIDLGKIEHDINNSIQIRQAFLRDPVAFLRGLGIILSVEQETVTRQAASKIPPVVFEYGGLRRVGTNTGLGERGQIRLITISQG